jgi:hypothetical protein
MSHSTLNDGRYFPPDIRNECSARKVPLLPQSPILLPIDSATLILGYSIPNISLSSLTLLISLQLGQVELFLIELSEGREKSLSQSGGQRRDFPVTYPRGHLPEASLTGSMTSQRCLCRSERGPRDIFAAKRRVTLVLRLAGLDS